MIGNAGANHSGIKNKNMYLYRIWKPGTNIVSLRKFEWSSLKKFLEKNCKGMILYIDEIYTSEYKSCLAWDQDVIRGRVHKIRKSVLEQNRNLRALKKDLCL